MSVEFSWLLGAQAGRHQRALRRNISAHRGRTKKHVVEREIVDKKKKKYYNKKEKNTKEQEAN